VDDETRRAATDLIQYATTGACPTSAVVSIPSHLPPEQLTASCSLALDVRIIVLPAPAPHSIDCNLSQPPSRTFHLRPAPALLHRAPRTAQRRCTPHHLLTAGPFSSTLCSCLCLLLPLLTLPVPSFPPPLHLGTTSWPFVLC
jgi:hypothetical protein